MTDQPEDLVWICLHVEMSRQHGAQVDNYESMPRVEWEAMAEAEQEKWLEQATEDHLSNHVSAGAWVVDSDEVPASYRA